MTQTVVITGANRGIGLALSKAYASKGDDVIAVCRQTSDELSSLPLRVIQNIDISSTLDVDKLTAEIGDAKIGILINNAGILRRSSLIEPNFKDIMAQFEVNAVAPLKVVSALLGQLDSGSKIAMITSRMGSIDDNSSGGSYGYRMSKSALNAVGKSLAIDLRPKGISVALLHPGYVKTEMVNFGGEISAELSASRLMERIDELSIDTTGSFWHANGERLPW